MHIQSGNLDGYIFPKKNETIYDLSNKYGILPQAIIKFNNLKKPYNLSNKEKIYLPYPLIHNVKKGENIYDLSMIYAVSQSDIVELNDLKKPYTLEPFTNLKIPLQPKIRIVHFLTSFFMVCSLNRIILINIKQNKKIRI